MIGLILVELALIAVASVAFLLFFGDPRRKPDPTIAWHLWSFGALTFVEASALFTVGVGVPVPTLVFAVGFGGQLMVAVWRLVLVIYGWRADR